MILLEINTEGRNTEETSKDFKVMSSEIKLHLKRGGISFSSYLIF